MYSHLQGVQDKLGSGSCIAHGKRVGEFTTSQIMSSLQQKTELQTCQDEKSQYKGNVGMEWNGMESEKINGEIRKQINGE